MCSVTDELLAWAMDLELSVWASRELLNGGETKHGRALCPVVDIAVSFITEGLTNNSEQ